MSSRDQLLAEALLARLATITHANGYATDAGLNVFDGATGVPADRLPFLVLAESEEGVGSQKTAAGDGPDDVSVSLPMSIEGRIACNPEHPNTAARVLCADIRRALFGPGSVVSLTGGTVRLRYAGRVIDRREPGTADVGVTVKFEAVFSYSLG